MTHSIAQELRLAEAILDDALIHIQHDPSLAEFDTLQAYAFARLISHEQGLDLAAELAAARDREDT